MEPKTKQYLLITVVGVTLFVALLRLSSCLLYTSHLTLQALELQLHLLAELEVQCTQRLVQQQDLRLVDQTAGNGNTLLLAAGHLADACLLYTS